MDNVLPPGLLLTQAEALLTNTTYSEATGLGRELDLAAPEPGTFPLPMLGGTMLMRRRTG